VGFFDDVKPAERPKFKPMVRTVETEGDPGDEDGSSELEEITNPAWMSPPRGWVPGGVAIAGLVWKSEVASVFITKLAAFPTGFSFTLNTLLSSPGVEGLDPYRHAGPWSRDEDRHELPPELLRFGIEYPDGRATSFEHWPTRFTLAKEDPDPARHLVLNSGDGGAWGSQEGYMDCWVWPLPPPGSVSFICEWPKAGIAEAKRDLEADLIRAAAEQAEAIWE
jgi:hypothetical protein